MYTEQVMDHFTNPRNMGEIPDADGVGEVGNAKCGDIMKIYLDVEDEIIKASPKHQFYIVDKGWVRAKDLKVGDMVIADGKRKPIKKVKYEKLGKPIPMYNLSVDGINTYLITKYSILVHNINHSRPDDPI